MSVAASLQALRKHLEAYPQASLVAVSKRQPDALLQEAIAAGQLHFGENLVQELVRKQAECAPSIQWHLIGHLQTNKVKMLAPAVAMVQSVDSLKLLKELNKQAEKLGRVLPCLLQVHIAQEETKYGLSQPELEELLASPELPSLAHVQLQGLMGMATNTSNAAVVRAEFRGLRQLYDAVRGVPLPNAAWQHCSMGMSGDYALALEEGSTLIRVGSAIFGERA